MTDWDRRFLGLAEHIACWSKDPNRKVGAVVVRPNRTISSHGYNGFPRGVKDEPARYADQTVKRLMIVHAEVNAILAASEPLTGHTIYIHALLPCAACAAAIIQSGIARVVCAKPDEPPNPVWESSLALAVLMLDEAGIQLDLL